MRLVGLVESGLGLGDGNGLGFIFWDEQNVLEFFIQFLEVYYVYFNLLTKFANTANSKVKPLRIAIRVGVTVHHNFKFIRLNLIINYVPPTHGIGSHTQTHCQTTRHYCFLAEFRPFSCRSISSKNHRLNLCCFRVSAFSCRWSAPCSSPNSPWAGAASEDFP